VKVIVDLCVVPIGVGVNLAPSIAVPWAPVFQAIEACHTAVHAMGCPRITTVKVNTRTDRDQTLEDKVASVEALLQQLPEGGQ
jgi:uncharacterized protein YqgV (UPF0045/DUF77 family)